MNLLNAKVLQHSLMSKENRFKSKIKTLYVDSHLLYNGTNWRKGFILSMMNNRYNTWEKMKSCLD